VAGPIDSIQPGHLPPDLRAEGDLARARLAARDIAARLRCQPLLDRADGLLPGRAPAQA
jgi:hypothetical protein